MMLQANTTNKHNAWVWLALIATVVLTVWTSTQPESDNAADDLVSTITKPVQSTNNQTRNIANNTSVIASTETANQPSTWQVRNREMLVEKPTDLFPVHSWSVIVPVAKAKPMPPPPPVAPPTPFTYMGKMEDGPKGTLIFLMANNKVYSVSKGENVDAFWRLDGEDANQLMFTFLPLNLPQTLSKTQPLISPVLPSTAASALNKRMSNAIE